MIIYYCLSHSTISCDFDTYLLITKDLQQCPNNYQYNTGDVAKFKAISRVTTRMPNFFLQHSGRCETERTMLNVLYGVEHRNHQNNIKVTQQKLPSSF